jgi:hypothetical protein
MILKCLIPILLVLVTPPMLTAQPAGKPGTAGKTQLGRRTNVPANLPANVKLVIEVEEMPGRDNPSSFWEAGYEIRLIDWRTVVERTKSGIEVGDAGIILTQSSFAHKSLSEKDNRRLVVILPVKGTLLERLQEQAHNPQAFSLRSSVRLYDAQLDRNYTFKVDRIWQFKLFPDGEAAISINIKPDGAFSVWGPVPRTLPPGYTVVGTSPEN